MCCQQYCCKNNIFFIICHKKQKYAKNYTFSALDTSKINFFNAKLFEYFHFFDIISCRVYKNVSNNLFCKHCSWLEAPLLLDCFMPFITTRTTKFL